MDIISKSGEGNKYTINSAIAFVAYASHININSTEFSKVLSGLKDFINSEAIQYGGEISGGSFNKCNGDWYEWLIGIRAIEFFLENDTNFIVVKMPNATSFDVMSIYKSCLSELIYDLRRKLSINNVNLITSNPDFSIIDIRDRREELKAKLENISFSNISLSTISEIDNLYKQFIDYAELEHIKSFLSVKTTFRPDRRLQLAHEGSLMKALYTHLQTRTWTINPTGIRYYAAATSIGNADVIGLKTVATHSITDVKSLPQSAVDEIFKINSVLDVDSCLNHILSS
ncbi:Cfr10I/Bse634I family restriction endonuclease [Citrobacter freundii]|nr:Cfr10I/Bse634I family restriction endonuclease [Citrobacter freundii]